MGIKHIFALEGEWVSNMRRKDSIEPALKLLEQVCDIKHVFRKVATRNDLNFYLKKSKSNTLSKYSIIYFAFHGAPGHIKLGDNSYFSLEDIVDNFPMSFNDKVVHFGSCSTLKIKEKDLLIFKKLSGAKMVSGYTTDIDFIDSTILDIAFFNLLQNYERVSYVGKKMNSLYPDLCKRLGFITV